MRSKYRISMTLLLSMMIGSALAVPTDLANKRLQTISAEVRCLVCQNQTLLDSSAPLAQDLRRQIMEMINENYSDVEIMTFLTERYGDFVLYDPPFKASTFILWSGPILFLIFTLATLRKRLNQETSTC